MSSSSNFHSTPRRTSTRKSSFAIDDAIIDLRPYCDRSPYKVDELLPLRRVFRLFTTMGLRHLVVVDNHSLVVGMITRRDFLRVGAGKFLSRQISRRREDTRRRYEIEGAREVSSMRELSIANELSEKSRAERKYSPKSSSGRLTTDMLAKARKAVSPIQSRAPSPNKDASRPRRRSRDDMTSDALRASREEGGSGRYEQRSRSAELQRVSRRAGKDGKDGKAAAAKPSAARSVGSLSRAATSPHLSMAADVSSASADGEMHLT